MIPASMDEWLDIVGSLPEHEIPTDTSTVAYAVRVALSYRAEYRALLAEVSS